jgi:CheY-like chemotaxis protein
MATVLVADDDTAGRLLVRTVLEHWGHVVVEAASGPGVLAAAAECAPDLLLLDLGLPLMSGPEVLRALRAGEATRDVRVALYTATPTSAALRDLMEIYGVVAAIPKPSEPQELIEAVERALRKT